MNYKAEEVVCEVCGSSNAKLIWEKKPWSQTIILKDGNDLFHDKDVMCLECGLIYKNPMLTKDCLREFYDGPYAQMYKPQNTGGISKQDLLDGVVRTTYVLDFLKSAKCDLQGMKVFEIGSGMGMLLKGVQSLGAEVFGIDMDKRSCDIAKKLFAFDIPQVDFEKYTCNETYDMIFICNTLEHFYSPREILCKVFHMLGAKGKLLVEIPSYVYPYVNIPIDSFLSSAHNYTFDYFSFCNLSEQCGYKIDFWGHTGHNKSMQFILSKKSVKQPPRTNMLYNNALARLIEQDNFRHKIVAIKKELFESTDVSIIIEKVLDQFPHTSNQAFIEFARPLLESGRNEQTIVLMDQYREGQSENIEICYATSLHLKGIALRQMGDFLAAKKYFMDAKKNYPRFENYNFIEELKIDGIISDSSFSPFTWWNNNKMLEALG